MQQWLANGISFPNIRITDILEIIIIAVIVYEIMVWIKSTKTWMLLKGLMALGLFILIAYLLNLHTILWLAEKIYCYYGNSNYRSATAGIEACIGKAGREEIYFFGCAI